MPDAPSWQQLLQVLVEAARAVDDPNERFRATRLTNRHGPRVWHRGFLLVDGEHRWIRAPKRDLDELRDRRLVRVEERSRRVEGGGRLAEWYFDITDAGYEQIDQAARAREPRETADTTELGETWTSRELPILRAALRRFDAGQPLTDLEELRVELGLTGDQMWAATHALKNSSPPYIDVSYTGGWRDDRASGSITAIHERARRELGTWPTADTLVTDIADALRAAADQATQTEDRSRLRIAADALTSFARDVAVAVAARHLGA